MPPHCDSLDGPVVTAARAALETGDERQVLPYVHAEGEAEVRAAFRQARAVRAMGAEAQELADQHFFETVVRVHRAGEGAPYTGLKPAGLDVGPVIPLAERAGLSGDPSALADMLADEVRAQVERRVARVRDLEAVRARSLEDDRRYVEALLGLQVYSHRLYGQMRTEGGH